MLSNASPLVWSAWEHGLSDMLAQWHFDCVPSAGCCRGGLSKPKYVCILSNRGGMSD